MSSSKRSSRRKRGRKGRASGEGKPSWGWGLVVLVLVLGLFWVAETGWLQSAMTPILAEGETGGSLWLVFLTGLTAGGLSCVAVQGGLLATTVARREQLLLEEKHGLTKDGSQATGHAMPILLFLGAKLVAYTLLGALLGLFGSWISLSPTMRGWLQILIGLFMLGMALQSERSGLRNCY